MVPVSNLRKFGIVNRENPPPAPTPIVVAVSGFSVIPDPLSTVDPQTQSDRTPHGNASPEELVIVNRDNATMINEITPPVVENGTGGGSIGGRCC